jgi:alkylation response protein AidB-like acyl-CoA dehydrogenase
VINGTKQFITCIDVADSVLVVCRTGSDERGRVQLSLFVVETDAPGLSMSPIRMELRVPDRHSSVYFDDVVVPDENLIGGVPHQAARHRQVFSSLNPERITVAAQAVGLARYFLDKAVAYAKQRTVWDEPIGAHQAVAHPLAETKIATDLAQLMTVKAAWLFDHGLDAGAAAGVAKLAAADAALAALDQAIQVHGGSGLATESGLADLWGLTRLMRVAPVSKEMVLNHVSQRVLGLPRSY